MIPKSPLVAFEGALEKLASSEVKERSDVTAATTPSAAIVSAASRALQPAFEQGQGKWIVEQLKQEEEKKKKNKGAEKKKNKGTERGVGVGVGLCAPDLFFARAFGRCLREVEPLPQLRRHHPLSTRFHPEEEDEEVQGGGVLSRLADSGPRTYVRGLLFLGRGGAPPSSSSSSSSSDDDDDDDEDSAAATSTITSPAAVAASALRLWNLNGIDRNV